MNQGLCDYNYKVIYNTRNIDWKIIYFLQERETAESDEVRDKWKGSFSHWVFNSVAKWESVSWWLTGRHAGQTHMQAGRGTCSWWMTIINHGCGASRLRDDSRRTLDQPSRPGCQRQAIHSLRHTHTNTQIYSEYRPNIFKYTHKCRWYNFADARRQTFNKNM